MPAPSYVNPLHIAQSGFRLVLEVFGLLALSALVFGGPAQSQGLSASSYIAAIRSIGDPIEVGVGIEIKQITSVDQQSENFGAVVTLRMEWTDPKLSFTADEGDWDFRIISPEEFIDIAAENEALVPWFTIDNQQGNRWIHNEMIVIHESGFVRYLERSSLTLQAPYFNFRRYPFDTQTFFFEIVSNIPEELVKYRALDDQSGLGPLLGEEEWVLGNAQMEISTVEGLSGRPSAKAALRFEGHRHIQYYMSRIFLPLLILIVVSWAAFFLDDYRKRAEVAGANLLVFVAFNWAISADLPRLGYLTFLDFVVQWMFIVTALIIVFNVFLTYLEAKGKDVLASKLDTYVIRWIYPMGYAAILGFAASRFLFT